MKPYLLIPLLILTALAIQSPQAHADDWIFSNTQDIPLTNSAGMFVKTGRERVVSQIQVAVNIGGKLLTTYDCRVIPLTLNTNGMSAKEMYLASMANSVPFTAGYFRGQVALAELDEESRERTGRSFPQWVTAFSSGDRKKLAIVWDDGPISVSTNYGTAWQTITNLGQHEFILSATPKGSALFARVSLGTAQKAVITRVARIVNNTDWYLAATAADGTRLVIAGGVAQSPPALSISPLGESMILSWSVETPGFLLQRKADANSGDWSEVTNSVNTVNGAFQVAITKSDASGIFRLHK